MTGIRLWQSGQKYLNSFLSDHSAIYSDEKTGKWLSAAELQLLGGKRFPGLHTNLLTKEQFVKSRLRKILTFLNIGHHIMEKKIYFSILRIEKYILQCIILIKTTAKEIFLQPV